MKLGVTLQIKAKIRLLLSSLGLSMLAFHSHANTVFFQIQKNNKVIADVVRIDDLSKLNLVLNDRQNKPFKKFSAIQKSYPNCQISFAMNAGMYHANFTPVGLYVEDSKQLYQLNQQKNLFGNFFMQPNGVVAWNNNRAIIKTTEQFKTSEFKATYATQSGPMLVIDGLINPLFEQKSDSLKVRNGVGIKNNQLYFVISRGRINFYDFADIFKTQLKINQALYLDGSISSAYIPQAKRNDQVYDLGPIFVYDESDHCTYYKN